MEQSQFDRIIRCALEVCMRQAASKAFGLGPINAASTASMMAAALVADGWGLQPSRSLASSATSIILTAGLMKAIQKVDWPRLFRHVTDHRPYVPSLRSIMPTVLGKVSS